MLGTENGNGLHTPQVEEPQSQVQSSSKARIALAEVFVFVVGKTVDTIESLPSEGLVDVPAVKGLLWMTANLGRMIQKEGHEEIARVLDPAVLLPKNQPKNEPETEKPLPIKNGKTDTFVCPVAGCSREIIGKGPLGAHLKMSHSKRFNDEGKLVRIRP